MATILIPDQGLLMPSRSLVQQIGDSPSASLTDIF